MMNRITTLLISFSLAAASLTGCEKADPEGKKPAAAEAGKKGKTEADKGKAEADKDKAATPTEVKAPAGDAPAGDVKAPAGDAPAGDVKAPAGDAPAGDAKAPEGDVKAPK